MHKDVFTSKLIKLLLIQQGRISRSAVGIADPHSDWKSVGEILGSRDYENHLKNSWQINKEETWKKKSGK
jgi:hypothetical protein